MAGLLATPLSDAVPSRPAAGPPAAVSPGTPWAYAGSQIVNQSTGAANYSVAQAGSYAWSTSLTELSTGPVGFSLSVERGMVTSYSYRLCQPNCAEPSYLLSATWSASEWTEAGLNLTGSASLASGGSQVPAVGLLNASVRSVSHFTGSTTVTTPSTGTVQQVRTESAGEAFRIAFSAPLALFPSGGLPTGSWSSPSNVTGSGAAWISDAVATTGASVPASLDNRSVQLPALQALTVEGAAGGSATLSDGTVVSTLAAASSGAFRLLDGIVPSLYAGSLFSALPAGGGVGLLENGTVVDLDSAATGHLADVAVSTTFVASVSVPAGAPAPSLDLAQQSLQPPIWSVQARPESPSDAAAQFSAWGLTGAPTPSRTSVAPSGPFAALPAGADVVAVAAIVGIVVAVAVRRRLRALPVSAASPAREPEPSEDPTPTREPSAGDPFDDLL